MLVSNAWKVRKKDIQNLKTENFKTNEVWLLQITFVALVALAFAAPEPKPKPAVVTAYSAPVVAAPGLAYSAAYPAPVAYSAGYTAPVASVYSAYSSPYTYTAKVASPYAYSALSAPLVYAWRNSKDLNDDNLMFRIPWWYVQNCPFLTIN